MSTAPAYLPIHPDATTYTGLSRRTLEYARDRGELPVIRKGRRVLFAVTDLDAWMLRDRIDLTADAGALDAAGKVVKS